MSELIDREAVREFIKSYRHSTDVAFDMEDHLDEIPAATRWVRCEEELPKVGETVLAWEHGQFAIVDKYCGDGKWGLSDALARYSHWMPLPDAPGGEK